MAYVPLQTLRHALKLYAGNPTTVSSMQEKLTSQVQMLVVTIAGKYCFSVESTQKC